MAPFVTFSLQHILIIIFGIISVFALLFLSNINHKLFPKTIGIIILILKISELAYRHIVAKEPIYSMLPLHLCNLTIIFAILVIAFRVNSLFGIVYFWSVGAIFAILTPDCTIGLPYFPTISFFVTHFFIIFAPLCCIFVFNMHPSKKDYLTAFIGLNICAIIIFFINKKLGTNYLFINRVPEFSSPLKLFGPWPYYIIVIEALYLVISYLMYLPFKRSKTIYTPKR